MRQSAASKPTSLYKITNLINGKFYIGITCKPVNLRFNCHIYDAKRHFQKNSTLQKALRKYGRAGFKVDVLAVYASYAEAIAAEKEAIARLRPQYNCTQGGDGAVGYKHTAENIALMSALKKGKSSHMKGKRHTLEARQKMSASLKGKPGFWKGKKLLPHVVENLRRVHAGRTDWPRIRAMGWEALRRKVVCLDDGLVFDSITDAASYYDLDGSSICEVCSRSAIRKTAGNRVFRYFGDHLGGAAEAIEVKRVAQENQGRWLNHGQGAYRRPVQCIDDGRIFPSVKDAAEHYGVPAWTISKLCRGIPCGGARGPKPAKGLKFKWHAQAEAADGLPLEG